MEKYQIKAIRNLTENINIKGKKILEIGGDLSYSVASHFVKNGAAHVTTINIDLKFPTREINNQISAVNLNATQLTKYYQEETFDVVFGVAVLEHIKNTTLLLKEIYSVLKNNGIVLLQGGPIWTCSIGHHVWVNCEDNNYRFNNKMKNPIPNWYHLILSPDEMICYLIEKKIQLEDTEKIVDYIYHDSDLSRISYSDLLDVFHKSPFKILQVLQNYGAKPEQNTLNKLERIFEKQQQNFEVNGIQFLLQKNY